MEERLAWSMLFLAAWSQQRVTSAWARRDARCTIGAAEHYDLGGHPNDDRSRPRSLRAAGDERAAPVARCADPPAPESHLARSGRRRRVPPVRTPDRAHSP